jgi:hypothetical protein
MAKDAAIADPTPDGSLSNPVNWRFKVEVWFRLPVQASIGSKAGDSRFAVLTELSEVGSSGFR